MTDLAATRPRLRELAEATSEQVHPGSWSYWVTQVLMAGPARDFIEAASPQTVLALLADTPSVEPLDVERLARAMHAYECGCDDWTSETCHENKWSAEGDATGVAAAYLLPTQASDSPEKTT